MSKDTSAKSRDRWVLNTSEHRSEVALAIGEAFKKKNKKKQHTIMNAEFSLAS